MIPGEPSLSAGQRTPRPGPESQTSSRPSSPTKPVARRGSTLGPHPYQSTTSSGGSLVGGPAGMEGRRRGSVPRTLSTPAHADLSSLGLGPTTTTDARRAFKDDALASPRRISTSRGFSTGPGFGVGHYPNPSTSSTATASASSLLAPSMPTNEAYYSQPPSASASTPRFRQASLQPYGALHASHAQEPSTASSNSSPRAGFGLQAGRHHRNFSVNSIATSHARDTAPRSPVGSVIRRIRKTASAIGLSLGTPGSYDGEAESEDEEEVIEAEDEARKSNGTRVWYSSFVTIDWIHDAIKESSRVRKMRTNAKKSYRGALSNTWDRFQGWLVVTIVGILSAIIAYLIIRTEMALFDVKDGFCSTSWMTPKRFCCTPRHRLLPDPSFLLLSPHSSPYLHQAEDTEDYPDWKRWGEWLDDRSIISRRVSDTGVADLGMYAVIALILATSASILTIYLSSSEHHFTSKDSALSTAPPTPAQACSNGKADTEPADETRPLLPLSPGMRPKQARNSKPPRKVMYYAAGSGIPEIKCILSGFVIHGYLGGWTLFTKSSGLALSVASGLSLGKEGPLVHIASCVGNIVSRLFLKFELNEAKRREVLSAACAAGVSVAFGAPIGGVLFSLEEVSYFFPPKVMWRSFWCAAVAAIALKALNPFGNGSIVLLAVTYTKPYHWWEFGVFALLGVFGGVYGAVFSRLNILWAKNVRQGTWVGRHPILEVLLVTALTTLVSFTNPYCRMGGTELVATLFKECKHDSTSGLCVDRPSEIMGVIMLIGSALLVKGCLTIITFGIKLPAGIFIPSLVVGACFGRIAGLSMELLEHRHPQMAIFDVCRDTECIVPGLYAMIGAAATLAGVTRTTVSLVVIMIELTGSLNYVVPIMMAVLLAKTVADLLEKKGIYDLVIDLNQLPYLDSKHEYLWGSRVAEEVADTASPILRADKPHTVRSLTGKLLELARGGMSDTGFPILVRDSSMSGHSRDEGGERGREIGKTPGKERARDRGALRALGFLGMNELEHALSSIADEPDARLNLMPTEESRLKHSMHSIFSLGDSVHTGRYSPYDLSRYIDQAPITVQPHSPLELVQQLFVKLGARQLLVVDGRGAYRGIITKKSWLNFLAELESDKV